MNPVGGKDLSDGLHKVFPKFGSKRHSPASGAGRARSQRGPSLQEAKCPIKNRFIGLHLVLTQLPRQGPCRSIKILRMLDSATLDRPTMSNKQLTNPALFFNRELSLLEFQKRVLAQATLRRTPLLEKLRFLTICSSNLDEFFEIRVAGLKQQIQFGLSQPSVDGRTPARTLEEIHTASLQLVREQYEILNERVLPDLAKEGIRLLRRNEWSEHQKNWVKQTFREEVLPVLSPIALDPAHPFPQLQNKILNFAVRVEGNDAFGRNVSLAVVNVPRSLPRVLPFPADLCDGYQGFTLLSSVIHDNIGEVFPGLDIRGCYQFRVTRNSDLEVDEEEVDNLLSALKGELNARRFSQAVRLEVASDCPKEIATYLLDNFGLEPFDLYQVNGPVNLHRLSALIVKAGRPDLTYPSFVPGTPAELQGHSDMFEAMRQDDILLHHPYQSFKPVVDLVRQAAKDPQVLAIKQTLYRTGAESPIVDALARAARSGKDVTVVIEIRARFDEAENIELATRLQNAGATVVYGVVGYKTHAKMLLIVRRELEKLRQYVHLGTGNYHTSTAKLYTDLGLLTCDKKVVEDVHKLFMQLTGLGRVPKLRKLLQAPTTLYSRLLDWIREEAESAQQSGKGHIIAKMNSLSDPGMIRALYRASQAGVKVELIVRGICRLRPGVKGVSENITVRSIVGRFLEHPRVYYFYANGKERVLASSADWMERNLHNRVEACFPIEGAQMKRRIMREVFEAALEDNSEVWLLQQDGSYRLCDPGEQKRRSAQGTALRMLAG